MNISADPATLLGSFLLIEAEMNSAIDPGVVDVAGDVLEPFVFEGYTRQFRDR
ncbi:MAG: hypothetical protein ACREQ1_01185 [Woeseiaceae bacterium]